MSVKLEDLVELDSVVRKLKKKEKKIKIITPFTKEKKGRKKMTLPQSDIKELLEWTARKASEEGVEPLQYMAKHRDKPLEEILVENTIKKNEKKQKDRDDTEKAIAKLLEVPWGLIKDRLDDL